MHEKGRFLDARDWGTKTSECGDEMLPEEENTWERSSI